MMLLSGLHLIINLHKLTNNSNLILISQSEEIDLTFEASCSLISYYTRIICDKNHTSKPPLDDLYQAK